MGSRLAALIAALSLALAAPAAAGSLNFGYVDVGHTSAGASFGLMFNQAKHQLYGLSVEFDCSAARHRSFSYGLSTSSLGLVNGNGVIGPFALGKPFRAPFRHAYIHERGPHTYRRAGTATVTLAGTVTETGALHKGKAPVRGTGTISIVAAHGCRTGTLQWTARGSVLSS